MSCPRPADSRHKTPAQSCPGQSADSFGQPQCHLSCPLPSLRRGQVDRAQTGQARHPASPLRSCAASKPTAAGTPAPNSDAVRPHETDHTSPPRSNTSSPPATSTRCPPTETTKATAAPASATRPATATVHPGQTTETPGDPNDCRNPMNARSRTESRSGVVPDDEATRIAAGVGAEIARLRGERGWAARELSRRARLAHSTVGRIESGRMRPRGSTLDAIAQVLAESPEAVDDLAGQLRALTGDSLAPDNARSAARRLEQERQRRAEAGMRATVWGRSYLPPPCPWCGR